MKLFAAVLGFALSMAWLPGSAVHADVRLPKILASKMVLQRNSDVLIWGWADGGERVRVTCDWLDESSHAVADADGNWQVRLKTTDAAEPHTISIAGNNTITLDQILFGEVWIASGQSNMEMPLARVSGTYSGIQNAEAEIAAANFPEIRLFQVGNFSSKAPLLDVETGISMYGVPVAKCQWQACTPESVPTFASTAYFFARELHRELKIPIGIIDASWGGTRAESWMPAAGLKALGYSNELERTKTLPQKAGEKIPTRLFNGMIHPLRNFTIRGVVWYQGEQNAAEANRYGQLFITLIKQWRGEFGSRFPFYFVQAAPYNYPDVNAAYLREAQLEATALPKTGMVVTSDIGDLKDVHPKNKQEVGRRLALWALANDYGRDAVHSGPVFKDVGFENGEARLTFDHTGSGLATRDEGPPSHFEIAGPDKVFQVGRAVIRGNEAIVSSDKIADPRAVRYGFTSRAEGNLTNKEGLPASPFRTDRW